MKWLAIVREQFRTLPTILIYFGPLRQRSWPEAKSYGALQIEQEIYIICFFLSRSSSFGPQVSEKRKNIKFTQVRENVTLMTSGDQTFKLTLKMTEVLSEWFLRTLRTPPVVCVSTLAH